MDQLKSYLKNINFQNLENEYFKSKDQRIKPYLGYSYYQEKNYHLSYAFTFNMNDNISILYNLLSLFQLGYEYIAIELTKNVELTNIYDDVSCPIEDRMLLAIMLKSKHEFNCSIDLKKVYDIQESLINHKTDISFCEEEFLKDYALRTDIDMLKARIYTLLGNYIDNQYYDYCDEDILKKYIDSMGIRGVVRSFSLNERKYTLLKKNRIKKIYKNNYKDNQIEIISYSYTIGNNMYVIKTPFGVVIVDSGKKIDDNDFIAFEDFFKENNIDKNDIKGIIYTHAHLDHIGNAISLNSYLGGNAIVYATKETQDLSYIVNDISFDLFKYVDLVKYDSWIDIVPDKLKIRFYPNGHILGSICFILEFSNLGEDKTLMFTSDFCLHDQLTLKGMDLQKICNENKRIDYLIIESTYGTKTSALEYEDNLKLFKDVVHLMHKYNIKCFFPAFAIGRSQEILLLLQEMKMKKIYIEGLTKNVCDYYNESLNLDLFRNSVNLMYDDMSDESKIERNDFIIASSGTLMENTISKRFYDNMIKSNEKIALIKTGYITKDSYGDELLENWNNAKDKYLFDISLSCHASYSDLIKTIIKLEPEVIVCVHGDGIKIK